MSRWHKFSEEGYPSFESDFFTCPYFVTDIDGEVFILFYHSYGEKGFFDACGDDVDNDLIDSWMEIDFPEPATIEK